MRLLAADAWRFVERTGQFRKLPTPVLPGSGKGYSAQCGSQPYGAPVFMSAHSIRAGGQKVKPADIIRPGGAYVIPLQGWNAGRRDMKADPEQRAVQLGSTLLPTTPRCGQRRLRSGAASPPCTRMLPCGCAASALRCTGRCVPCWRATRPSATCGAVLPPGADTAAAKAKKDRCPAQRSFLTGTILNGRRAALAIFRGKHDHNSWFKNTCGCF